MKSIGDVKSIDSTESIEGIVTNIVNTHKITISTILLSPMVFLSKAFLCASLFAFSLASSSAFSAASVEASVENEIDNRISYHQEQTTKENHKQCVVLLHGLARTESSLKKMAKKLEAVHYQVVNYHYPSKQQTIQVLAKNEIPKAIAQCGEASRIHFVTHSMGGILVRQYFSNNTLDNMGRVVMLGPPNHGSEVIDTLQTIPSLHWINGPAGMQLGTGMGSDVNSDVSPEISSNRASVPNSLGAAPFDVGIIAGTRSINVLLSQIIPGTDDGKVSVKSTQLKGMKDHITLPVTHTFMMQNDDVIAQVIYFLREGYFLKNAGTDEDGD